MKAWQAQLERRLAGREGPAVLTRDLIARFARSAAGESVPASTLSHWLRRLVEQEKLAPVKRGLYLNRLRMPPAQAVDATPWLFRDAVVSLNTVLGDAGVLNNPTHSVTAVVPIDRGAPPPRLGRRRTPAGDFHFFGLPRRIVEAGAAADRLEPESRFEHVRATPEKALVDWLYLGASPRSRRQLPPRHDIDLELLDMKRLRRLAKAAGAESVLEHWLAGGTQ